MVSFLHHTCVITFDLSRVVEALSKSLRFMDERTGRFDWLAYYHSISEWRREREEARLVNWIILNHVFQTYDRTEYSLADFVARIRALRERMWSLLSRTSQCEGRHKSLLATIPTPPTMIASGRMNGCPIL